MPNQVQALLATMNCTALFWAIRFMVKPVTTYLSVMLATIDYLPV